MKELHARAQGRTAGSVEDTVAMLAAVENYPRWYPDGVKSASVTERDAAGVATKVRTTLHVATGPFVKDFTLDMTVTQPSPGTIRLTRIPHDARDQERFQVTWTVTPAGSGAQISVAFDANLSVPRFVPVGGVGESIANGFVSAASRALGR